MELNAVQIAKLKGIMINLVSPEARIGNLTLSPQFLSKAKADENLDLTDDDYWFVRDRLIEDGKLQRGKGKGGSVAVAVGQAPAFLELGNFAMPNARPACVQNLRTSDG